MKKTLFILACALSLASCSGSEGSNPYTGTLCTLTVNARYPEEYSSFVRAGADVTVEDVNLGSTYKATTDGAGAASLRLPCGLYRVRISDIGTDDIFNGSVSKFKLVGDAGVDVALTHSKAGTIVFKEIYCGGCMKYPEQGTYQADQYVILHNNYARVQYLDGLCFGTLAPYNSNSANPFLSVDPVTGDAVLPDFVPVIQAVWQFGGDGDDFPLQPGEDAVLALRGAIDHSAQYPLSVNLNCEGYFVCYNATYFTNPSYHPAPGNNISEDRFLDVVIKTGQANAYTFSLNSPAAVLFRAPEGTSMRDYVQSSGAVIQIPGSSVDRVVVIDPEWVVDAVEVFNGSSTSNVKRLLPSLDAGYVSLSGTFLGHSLLRRKDEALSSGLGFEVLMDTNNSSEDFYETEKQTLHE